MTKIFTVFGATGNQGGSVIKTVLAHPELSKTYKIRAVTRDTSKASATALKEKGAEVVAADMNDKDSIFKAIEGSTAVFGVTNFWETMNADSELQQGKTLVDASKAAGVEHFIFSSLPNVSKATNGKITSVKHFDSKAMVEEHAREVGLSSTFFMPGAFMSMMLDNFKKDESGSYALSLPVDPKKSKIPLVDIADDAGLFVATALLKPKEIPNSRIVGASVPITPEQMVEDFKAATGKEAKYNHIPYKVFRSFLPPPVAEELTGNMQLMEEPGYYVGEPADAVEKAIELVVSAGLRKPTTWKEYVQQNFKE